MKEVKALQEVISALDILRFLIHLDQDICAVRRLVPQCVAAKEDQDRFYKVIDPLLQRIRGDMDDPGMQTLRRLADSDKLGSRQPERKPPLLPMQQAVEPKRLEAQEGHGEQAP